MKDGCDTDNFEIKFESFRGFVTLRVNVQVGE